MTTPQPPPDGPKKTNCFLWGCLIVLVLICLVFACLLSVVGLSFAGIDPLGLNLEDQIDNIMPWQEYEEPYYDPTDEDKDIAPDDGEDPTLEVVPESGFDQLAPFYSDNFSFSFYYPEGWDIEEEELLEMVYFYDPDSNGMLAVGREWVCQGCLTAADIAARFMDNMIMESKMETFVVIEDSPYVVSSGEDAHLSAFEWSDIDDGTYMWAYVVDIYVEDPVEDMNVYFVMWGDDTTDIAIYGELLEKVAASYSK